MSLHSPHRTPERILTFGAAGTGKSSCILQIAKWSQLTGSDAQFYIADTEVDAIDHMLEIGYPSLTNVHTYPILDYQDILDFQKDYLSKIRPHDWVSVDSGTLPWDLTQSAYIDEIFHKDPDQYYIEARRAMKKDDKGLQGLEGWVDWPVVNKMYRRYEQTLILKTRCHVLVTAEQEELRREGKLADSKEIIQDFDRYGYKPKGQKSLPYRFHTILYMQRDKGGRFKCNTVKDRERIELVGADMTAPTGASQFVQEYLIKCAGWTFAA